MRRRVVELGVLALLLGGSGLTWGQSAKPDGKEEKSPARSKLEELLAEALKANPDVRVAAAKVSKAEAELSRARLKVMKGVVTLHGDLEAARQAAEEAERRFRFLEKQAKR